MTHNVERVKMASRETDGKIGAKKTVRYFFFSRPSFREFLGCKYWTYCISQSEPLRKVVGERIWILSIFRVRYFFFETKGEEMSLPKNGKDKVSADFPHLSPMNVKRRVGRRAPIVGFPYWGCLEPCWEFVSPQTIVSFFLFLLDAQLPILGLYRCRELHLKLKDGPANGRPPPSLSSEFRSSSPFPIWSRKWVRGTFLKNKGK